MWESDPLAADLKRTFIHSFVSTILERRFHTNIWIELLVFIAVVSLM